MMNFTQQMEELFGTDAACGVTFTEELAEGTPRTWTAAEYDALPEPKPDTFSSLPNDWSGTTCTGYAHLVKERLGADRVQVVGFANKDNPASLIAIEEWHPGGHDFALVDGRYIVDPWPRLVCFGAGSGKPIVYDLLDPETVRIYGPRECWKDLAAPAPVAAPAAAPTDAEARRVALNLKPAATPEEIAHFIAHWQAGHEGKGIDPTTRGHALAAYAEGIKAREMAQRAAAPTDAAPTDLSKRLRAAAEAGFATNLWRQDIVDAADEIERYYGGMLAWKRTAEKKDRDWNEERMARVNERCDRRAVLPPARRLRKPHGEAEVRPNPNPTPRPPALPAKPTNVLEFKFTLSDRSRLEGAWRCSDSQWARIVAILAEKPAPHSADKDPR